MTNQLEDLSETIKWRLMVDAAKRGAQANGYQLTRVPGRGLSNVWTIVKNGKAQRAAIRTTRDRWIAFASLGHGTKWKTLDEVEAVIIATVDSKEDPENIDVFIVPADEVRKHFDAAYAGRAKAGLVVKEDFGMWVGLDRGKRDSAYALGSGIIEKHKRVAAFSIAKLFAESADGLAVTNEEVDETAADDWVDARLPRFSTIAQVVAWAREQVAVIAGVRVEAVRLDLKLEY